MAKPKDINLEDTKLYRLYFYELWCFAHSIKSKADRVFNKASVPETGYVIQVDPDLHSLIASLLSDAANLKKLLVTPSNRLRNESGRQFRLRRARTKILRQTLGNLSLVEILNAKVRNTLEHFDEYLDEANLLLSEAKVPASPMAAYNMVLSHWEAVQPPVYPIRLYVSSERKFYNMKWSVDIGAMHREASSILEHLVKHDFFPAENEPGGLMIRLK